jgi:hypothetical protein
MMRDLDQMIDEALDVEERELLRSIGEEPGYIRQALGIFSGSLGWLSAILMAVQGAAFLGGAWAAWNFFTVDDILSALRWGLPASVLLLMSLMIKLAMWPTLEANRLMRELKRIELQLAHAKQVRNG